MHLSLIVCLIIMLNFFKYYYCYKHLNFYYDLSYERSFPGITSGKEFACKCRRHGFNPWASNIP